MLTLEKTALFEDINGEESAIVGGGRSGGSYYKTKCYDDNKIQHFDLDTYLFVLGAGVTFGNPGLTPDEIHAGWLAGLGL
jgi:hypothetical protein